MRVVAEAVRAARLRDDLPCPAASRNDRFGILGMTHEHDHAIVVRAQVVLAGEHGDELLLITGVLSLASGRRAGRRRTREPRRAYARLAAERAEANARV